MLCKHLASVKWKTQSSSSGCISDPGESHYWHQKNIKPQNYSALFPTLSSLSIELLCFCRKDNLCCLLNLNQYNFPVEMPFAADVSMSRKRGNVVAFFRATLLRLCGSHICMRHRCRITITIIPNTERKMATRCTALAQYALLSSHFVRKAACGIVGENREAVRD